MTQISGATTIDAAIGGAQNRFNEMSSEDFLQIIFTELTNQDPLQPNDTSALLDQLNSIRSIESDIALTERLDALVTENQLASAGSLLGKAVTGLSNDFGRTTGVAVSAIRQNDTISLELDTGAIIPFENVEAVVDLSMFRNAAPAPPALRPPSALRPLSPLIPSALMPLDPLHLLRRLEPPVRPAAAPAPRGVDGPGGFDELLALVSDGSVRSGRPVVADADAGAEALTAEQLERLAAAADLAEASGARRAVMLLDGRGLVMDIDARTVVDELTADRADRLVAIDTAVFVAGDGEQPGAGALGPGAGVVPAVISRYLQSVDPTEPDPRASGAD